MLYNSQTKLLPTGKHFIFNLAIDQNADIFEEDIIPKYAPTAFRIYACFDTLGKLRIARTYEGVTSLEDMNLGNDLKANAGYIFDTIVDEGMTINLQHSGAPVIAKYVTVVEIPTIQ